MPTSATAPTPRTNASHERRCAGGEPCFVIVRVSWLAAIAILALTKAQCNESNKSTLRDLIAAARRDKIRPYINAAGSHDSNQDAADHDDDRPEVLAVLESSQPFREWALGIRP